MKNKRPFRALGGSRPGPKPVDSGDRAGPIAQGVPLARILKRNLTKRPEVVMLASPRSIHAERFRRLKTNLAHLPDDGPQAIVITSGAPSEGKSTVAINLALAFAGDSDQRTLLIDANMRRPTLDRRVQPSPTVGLSHLLQGRATSEHAIIGLNDTLLEVLPAGDPAGEPMELLTSQVMKDLIRELRGKYERIVIDTPPVVPFTDADAIGALCDGVVLVARSRSTSVSVYQQALESVSSSRKLLGVVFNDVPKTVLADWSKYQTGSYDKYYEAYYKRDDGDSQ